MTSLSRSNAVATAVQGKLTSTELAEFTRDEKTIERGVQTFLNVGHALANIRDKKLYREKFKTFDEYCRTRWGFERTYAHRLIVSAEVAERVVKPSGKDVVNWQQTGTDRSSVPAPTHESQIRALTKLPEKEQPAAWREAVKTAPAGKLTAKHVETVVERRQRPAADPAAEEPEAKPQTELETALAGIEEMKAAVEACRLVFRRVLKVEGQEIKAPWLRRFSYLGTIGDLNTLLRNIEDYTPTGGGTPENPQVVRDRKITKESPAGKATST